MYYSRSDAFGKGDGMQMDFTFKVSVGAFQQIKADSAPSVKAVLPQTVSWLPSWLVCCFMLVVVSSK
jgi:hypothetical protein